TTIRDDTKVTVCPFCSSGADRSAAEIAALSDHPQLTEGAQYVYVFDAATENVSYFEVHREYVEICIRARDDDSSKNAILDPDDPPTIPNCSSSWATTSNQLTLEPWAIVELRAAKHEFEIWLEEISVMNVEELDLSDLEIDSATDLIELSGNQ
ncbi:MAG: hypothetical protein ACPGJE_09455, partial [Wenzhouxiangellaceae bacterium]